MRTELYSYDIFPKVFLCGKDTKVTVKPLGVHAGLEAGKNYSITVNGTEDGDDLYYPEWYSGITFKSVAGADGSVAFTYKFPTEQEYIISVFRDEPGSKSLVVRLSVYALEDDMKGRYPFRGDLHVHSCRSDGLEDPVYVCANYRRHGYDFMLISDHRRYYPSLDAIRAFEGVAPDFNIMPGEEVQIPLTDVHIINVGGDYSINALIDGNDNQKDRGDDPLQRSVNGICPEVLTKDEYEAQIKEISKANWFDAESANISYAACLWAFEQIKKAHGMSIYCHPYWRRGTAYHVPEKLSDRILKDCKFDAFEVLGGERYYEQNGFQTARYYEDLVRGIKYPVVGNTDTHGSTEHNINALICSTVIFAEKNERDSLTKAVKDYYSVAVDSISKEYRLVGSLRMQKYGCFLLEWYFPLHDRLCEIEGEYLRAYVSGDEKAKARLDLIAADVTDLMKKYIQVE